MKDMHKSNKYLWYVAYTRKGSHGKVRFNSHSLKVLLHVPVSKHSPDRFPVKVAVK